jgi:hypothetical protein
MDALRWAAYGAFGLAGLALALFAFDGFFAPFLGVAASLGVSGLLLLALDKGLRLLADIRDAIVRQGPVIEPISDVQADGFATDAPVKTVAELSGDLDRLKAKLG